MSETVPSVTPATLDERLRAGDPTVVLDVRDRDEFERWHVEGPAVEAVQASHAKFVAAGVTGDVADHARGLGLDSADRIVVVCGHGEASAEVAEMLTDAGFDAANLAGGMDDWADLSVAREVSGPDDGPTVVQYRRPSSGCLSYLVVSGDEAAVIDPLRAFADRYVADATDRGAALVAAVDTHVHADHVSGVPALAREGVEAVVPAGATDRGLDLPVPVRLLGHGESASVGATALSAHPLPGHTSEMTGLRLDRADAPPVLFCGDSLFRAAVARPDLEAGAEGATALAERLYDTLHDRLLSLPDETVLLPGHYASPAEVVDGLVSTTVGAARDRETLALSRDAFVDRVTSSMPPRPANYERIIAVNLGREAVEGSEAFELELGPNSCAAGGTAD
jgi:glyoxylase-like metal-dependent hydrolase (beta-lactamase superfamily II)